MAHGITGLVTDALKIVIAREPVGAVFRHRPGADDACSQRFDQAAQDSDNGLLNAIMVDGTGMCGGCQPGRRRNVCLLRRT